MQTILPPYDEFYHPERLDAQVLTGDHLDGFSEDLSNIHFARLNEYAGKTGKRFNIGCSHVYDQSIQEKYPNLDIRVDINLIRYHPGAAWTRLVGYTEHPPVDFKNFICSFNGSPHVSRKLLVSALHKFGYYHPDYCSKNFSFTVDDIDGHISDYQVNDAFYRKFFVGENSELFFQTINSFGHNRYKHGENVKHLESRLTQSFLHIASETMATSYYPFVSEKHLFSVVTRGLFLTYGQPGWHRHVETYYGFKPYTKLFDYRFDQISNPIERLIELLTMVSKFSRLSISDWHDLYQLESDTIEYNYDWYFSGKYLDRLGEFSS
jgi:hypothetical protein